MSILQVVKIPKGWCLITVPSIMIIPPKSMTGHWTVDRAMDFFALNPDEREVQIRRIMIESVTEFNHSRCAESYISLYEKMLESPFIVSPFLSKS